MKINQERIHEKVQKLLSNFLDLRPEEVSKSARLKEDLGVDSVDFMDISAALEKQFHIHINDEEVGSIVTVEDLIKFLDKNRDKYTAPH